jgi:hypothetical protein
VSLRDDFARWREDPMTLLFMKTVKVWQETGKQSWQESAFNGAWARPEDLLLSQQCALARDSVFDQVLCLNADDLAVWLELKPDAE